MLGVIPTATDKANSNASIKSCLMNAYITNTAIDTTTIYFINSFVMLFIPFSKFVISFLLSTSLLILPKYVSNPVCITTAVALPLTTLEPIKHMLLISNIPFGSFGIVVFSTNTLSPVNTDWFKNKSLLSINIISAGIIEPAFSFTISPIAIFSTLTSFSFPLLTTFVLEYICAFSF